jgi:hypothetical protein
MAWGKSAGVGGAYRQWIAAEDGRLEVSVASNAGVCSVMSFFPVGELRRMMDGGGRRCSVHRMVLGTHFILPGWCMMGNRGMGSANGACDSMARCSL